MMTYVCFHRHPWRLLWIVCVGIPVLTRTVSTEMGRTTRNEAEQQLDSVLNAKMIYNSPVATGFERSLNVPNVDAKKANAATAMKFHLKRSSESPLDVFKKTLSEKCRGQIDDCSSKSDEAKSGRYCDAFENSLAQKCITMGGKCSKHDFDELKSVACYVITAPTGSAVFVPGLTQGKERGLEALSPNCVKQIRVCQSLPSSPGSEDPCEIMRSSKTARQCLTGAGKCTGAEFNVLKNMACKGVDHSTQSDVLQTTPTGTASVAERIQVLKQRMSKKCQDQIDSCDSLSPEAQEGRYCEALSSVLAEGCITSPGTCTKNDFNRLKTTACDSSGVEVQTTPATSESVLQRIHTLKQTLAQKCRDQIDSCDSLSPEAQEGRYCEALSSVLAEGCITSPGTCTKNDFNRLKTTACANPSGGDRATKAPHQAKTHPVMDVIKSLNKTCQMRINTCSKLYPQATQDFSQLNYCQTFGSSEAKLCLLVTEDCSDKEYTELRTVSCGTAGAGAPTITLQLLIASVLLSILRRMD